MWYPQWSMGLFWFLGIPGPHHQAKRQLSQKSPGIFSNHVLHLATLPHPPFLVINFSRHLQRSSAKFCVCSISSTPGKENFIPKSEFIFSVLAYSPHLRVGFCFLVVHFRLLPRPPAARHFTHNLSTHSLLTHNLSPHNSLTHNLPTHNWLTHNLSPHSLSTHNLLTHNLSPHNLLRHNMFTHNLLTQLAHTQLTHTQLAHTFTLRGCWLHLVTSTVTLPGRRGTWWHRPSHITCSHLHFAWQAWHL